MLFNKPSGYPIFINNELLEIIMELLIKSIMLMIFIYGIIWVILYLINFIKELLEYKFN